MKSNLPLCKKEVVIKTFVLISAIIQAVNCFQCTYYNNAKPSLSAVNCTCDEDNSKQIVSFARLITYFGNFVFGFFVILIARFPA